MIISALLDIRQVVMRIFAIKSESNKKDLAYLLYYEKEKRFYIELPENADPWETPLLLASFLKPFDSVMIQPGGYGVYWSDRVMIADYTLYSLGQEIPLNLDDFRSFVSNRVIGTAEAMELLSCTRQNMNDLIKRGKLTPIKKEKKNTLFLKTDIIQRNWH